MRVIEAEGGILAAAATIIDRGDTTASRVAREFGVPYFPLTTYADFGIEPVATRAHASRHEQSDDATEAAWRVHSAP